MNKINRFSFNSNQYSFSLLFLPKSNRSRSIFIDNLKTSFIELSTCARHRVGISTNEFDPLLISFISKYAINNTQKETVLVAHWTPIEKLKNIFFNWHHMKTYNFDDAFPSVTMDRTRILTMLIINRLLITIWQYWISKNVNCRPKHTIKKITSNFIEKSVFTRKNSIFESHECLS